ncbi:hypothetical protein OEZ85_004436 [Tetradesmus obliquus]|uniref:Uncharacterized protein n=1 Tax=Tetradesmus obliquus TaxID=3088 RepID=A0ABY8UL59_TETOB|nr:hypothetical protein OEZ85_004436 [Tetradesmus obliquus]
MTCGGPEAQDTWTVVLSLPYGSDVEYKYVVLDQQGGVVSSDSGPGCFAGVNGSADARAEAFGGVDRALQQSAELLDSLADPTHPLMLKADRELADAKRHMGHLLAA